jgi:tetratricopeptide (TPR) repeat protein
MLAGREEKELLELVHGVLERNPDHVDGLRMLVRIHWWQRDMDALRSSLERLAEAAEAAELIDEERYALTQLVRLAPDAQRYLDRLNLLGGLQDETPEDFSAVIQPEEAPQFETFAVVEDEPSSFEIGGATDFESNDASGQVAFDPTSYFADLNEVTDAGSAESQTPSFQEVDFGGQVSETPVPAHEGTEEERTETIMRQELESVDFYISQGYNDIAVDTLEVLQKQFGNHPEIQARREKLNSGSQAPTSVAFEFGGVEEVTDSHEEVISLDADTAFASFADPSSDVATTANPVSATPASKGLDAGLAELFEEFRSAEEEDSGHGDYETHYNMGTAYKEMDLIDEAIQEFQTAVAQVKAGDGTSRFLQCCNMLGHCFIQKGLPEAAIMWFKRGLEAPGHSEDEYQALRYELGGAYEELGDLGQARQYYTEVYGVDVNYREVGEKLRKLKKAK